MGAVGWVSLGQAHVLGNVKLKLKLLPYDEGHRKSGEDAPCDGNR